jgi:hypothetical protein
MGHKDGGPVITRYKKVATDAEQQISEAVEASDSFVHAKRGRPTSGRPLCGLYFCGFGGSGFGCGVGCGFGGSGFGCSVANVDVLIAISPLPS